jgi:alcohol dehydrogenase (cytochrome c)
MAPRTVFGTGVLVVGAIATTAMAQRPPQPAATRPVPEGDWRGAGRDHSLTRFSPLTELTPGTVAGLKAQWSFSTGVVRAHEGNPLVVGPVLFVHSPFPNVVFALDLSRPGAPIKWRYSVPPATARLTLPTGCCDVGSRGLAYHPSGKIYVPLLHGELAALDAETGREIWRVRNGDGRAGATMPGAPIVVKDLVLIGTSGAEYGIRGALTAYDAATGRLVWRAWHTGSDADVLIDGEANSNYPSHRGRDLGLSTWTADHWQRGGATASGWISYDPELDLVYYGTDRPGPANAAARPGDNKWSSTIFARAAGTGKVRWALQLTPHDQWGYDASNESLLVDLQIGGAPVKALVHFDRNGFAYTVDRTTGKLLVAERFGPANWAGRIDVMGGQPLVERRFVQQPQPVTGICPAAIGAKGLEPASYSPVTSLFYVPGTNLCMDLTVGPVSFVPGKPYSGVSIRMKPGLGPNQGRLIAWDAATGTVSWQVQESYPLTGGTLATAGGLVFYGTMEGWLKAVDHKTGVELWRFKTPSGIVGSPISFLGPDGKQRIAVLSGLGGWIGLGANGAFPDVASISATGGVLTVFGL